jgi:serine/threonine-protein kinase
MTDSGSRHSTLKRLLGPLDVKGPQDVMQTLMGLSGPEGHAEPVQDSTAPSQRWIRESRVGSGGMGYVERVFDRVLDRRSAMKVQHVAQAQHPTARRLFLKEVRITGRLEHPNIVPVHEYGVTAHGEPFFTMKLVQGRTFQEILTAQGVPRRPDDIYDRLDIFLKVCDALAFAHSRGVVHCDIKPANVMVGEFGEVYLMDWGIAQVVDPSKLLGDDPPEGHDTRLVASRYPLPDDNEIFGTPAYLSPEQACGEELTFQSDVYALGVVLYEMFTGKQPFVGRDAVDTLERILGAELLPPSLIALDAWVPTEIERIIVRALDRDLGRRYPTVGALRADLVRFMRGGGEFPTERFEAGETICRRGEEGDAAYIINSGRCVVHIEEGDSVRAVELGPCDVFGEAAVLSSGLRNATVTALEPTTCYVVTSDVLTRQLDSVPEWMRVFITTLARRFGQRS